MEMKEYIFVFTKIDSTLFVHPNPSRIGIKASTFVDDRILLQEGEKYYG